MNDPTQPAPWLTERYHPQTCLGRKAGRQTWLAIDQHTQQPVVIKRLTFGPDFNWDDLKLFEREAQTLKSIDHPAIPTYLDFFDLEANNSQGFALVQTYIDARSIEDQVKTGRRFSETDLKTIASQLLTILDYLHHCQPPVIHRDIKPSNILLTDATLDAASDTTGPSQIYLVDFGSVQTLAAREGSTITVVGTYGYMPPEQFGGRAYPTSDLYSLGATLIYLATGKHPADIPQGDDLRLNFEPFADLSPDLTQWLRSLIHPNANSRPASAKLALASLLNPSLSTSLKPAKSQIPRSAIAPHKPKHCTIDFAHSETALAMQIPTRSISFREMGSKYSLMDPKTFILLFVFGGLLTMLIPFVWFGSAIILGGAGLINLFSGKVNVQLDDEFLTIDRGKFCLIKRRFKVPRRQIWKISILPVGISEKRTLTIAAANLQFTITLRQDEASWLAGELSHFLDLPIDF
jgi:serine/threonine protein kinase